MKKEDEIKLLKGFIRMALDELGVPNDEGYPAPVSNAVGFLNQALKGEENDVVVS